LVGNLIDALESDAGWVELYGITGELIVPDTYKEEDEIDGLLKRVKKVAIQLKSTALQSHVNFYSVWQTTDIQFLPQEGGGRFKFRLMFHS